MTNLKNLLPNLSSNKILLRLMAIVALIGVTDAVYLTANYYWGSDVKCLVTEGCEVVLTSSYSRILGIPLAGFGVIFYALMFVLVNMLDIYRQERLVSVLIIFGATGFFISISLLFIQFFILKSLCIYCIISFFMATLLFIMAAILNKSEMDI